MVGDTHNFSLHEVLDIGVHDEFKSITRHASRWCDSPCEFKLPFRSASGPMGRVTRHYLLYYGTGRTWSPTGSDLKIGTNLNRLQLERAFDIDLYSLSVTFSTSVGQATS